ncbi:hypothetical protein [Halobacterium sp. R2-5]|uniref:hypothetical protein n=1 Tax=Halobacterium sp. R2-5 TaxID=2715751 RepID=UPI00141E6B08|nr:hypothetical protein [Halobacterium sp. R2-5]NIC00315.1 hypothetical protein [Halobacterium sp. R2-5]
MRRRALLASSATLLGGGLAGCLGDSGGGEPATGAPTTDSTTAEPTESTTSQTTYDAGVSAAFERLQPNVVVLGVDSVGVRPDGSQYAFFHVAVADGDAPERSAFEFRFDGDSYPPGVDTSGTLWRDSEGDDRYTAARGAGWLVFELPETGDAGDAALALGGDEWSVAELVRERLEAPSPSLSLDWDAPEEQPAGTSTLGFTVTNDSERDTWFVGGVNAVEIRGAHAPVAGLAREIPARETVSWEITHENGKAPGDDSVGDGEPDGEYRLTWAQGEREQEVYFVAGE